MAISLVTGFAGQAHVTPAQDGAGYAGIVGTGCYVTKTGRMLAASMSTANKCVVCDGDAWMYGRHVHIEAGTTEELTVQSGSQGTKRNDLVVARYAKDATTGVETASLVVVKGTAGTTATDPAYNNGSILDGTSPVDMPLYRIPIDGITAGTPVSLFSVLAPMSELQDSISQAGMWHAGRGAGIAVVPMRDCILDVELSLSNVWGYAGGAFSLAINLPSGLAVLANTAAYGSGGDTVGRQVTSRLVASGAKAGQSYSFSYTLANGGGFSDPMWIARELPSL